jgi:hypothetical protein
MKHAGTVILSCAVCAVIGVASPGRAADAALYQAAKKEGEVVWYTALIVAQAVRPLIERRSARNIPGSMSILRAPTADQPRSRS